MSSAITNPKKTKAAASAREARVSKNTKGAGAKAGKDEGTEHSTQVAALLKCITDLQAERNGLKKSVEELKALNYLTKEQIVARIKEMVDEAMKNCVTKQELKERLKDLVTK